MSRGAENEPQQKTERKTMRSGMAGRKPVGESFSPPESKQLRTDRCERASKGRKKERKREKGERGPMQRPPSSLSHVFSIIHRNLATSGHGTGFRGPGGARVTIPLPPPAASLSFFVRRDLFYRVRIDGTKSACLSLCILLPWASIIVIDRDSRMLSRSNASKPIEEGRKRTTNQLVERQRQRERKRAPETGKRNGRPKIRSERRGAKREKEID